MISPVFEARFGMNANQPVADRIHRIRRGDRGLPNCDPSFRYSRITLPHNHGLIPTPLSRFTRHKGSIYQKSGLSSRVTLG